MRFSCGLVVNNLWGVCVIVVGLSRRLVSYAHGLVWTCGFVVSSARGMHTHIHSVWVSVFGGVMHRFHTTYNNNNIYKEIFV
jgi:hypothetical protein